jgi:hypothetical protein
MKKRSKMNMKDMTLEQIREVQHSVPAGDGKTPLDKNSQNEAG